MTDDVELTWRLQVGGWHVVYEPKAVCWILMPETIRGLWRQRLRWSEGGTQTILISLPKLLRGAYRHWRGWPCCANYLVSVVWAYLMFIGVPTLFLRAAAIPVPSFLPGFRLLPEWWGVVLALTYLMQALVSISLERRYEQNVGRALFWVVWYPLLFWTLQVVTAVFGLPRALFRLNSPRGTWVSPDRGVT